jgi:hypothetical protein
MAVKAGRSEMKRRTLVAGLKLGVGESALIEANHASGASFRPRRGRLIQVNDWSTYAGSLRSVSDSEIKNPPSMWIFNDINTWPEMGDHPGNYVSRGTGHKAYSFDEMPSTWKLLMKEQHPQIASDPTGALKG